MIPQPPLPEQQAMFVTMLSRYGVRYMVIGGRAIQANGVEDRQTQDLDILLDPDAGSIAGMAAFIGKFPVPPPTKYGSWEAALSAPQCLFQYPAPETKQVDVLTSIDGINFQECMARSVAVPFGDQEMQVACRDDLIAMKRISSVTGNDEAAHARDLADIESLQALT